MTIITFDTRRDIVIPGNKEATLLYSIDSFLNLATEAIQKRGMFTVALSGGSTPAAIYKGLALPENRSKVDWKRVQFFWSDERCVPKTDSDSNYHMAMDAGLANLPIPKENIHPMPSEGNLEDDAKEYEKTILNIVPGGTFDLVMLGMGDDGHTASLFPRTLGLAPSKQLVKANFLQEKNIWRMTFTYECINQARNIAIYVLGANKAETVKKVLTGIFEPETYPIQKVGTVSHKALWIMDKDAAKELDMD